MLSMDSVKNQPKGGLSVWKLSVKLLLNASSLSLLSTGKAKFNLFNSRNTSSLLGGEAEFDLSLIFQALNYF